MPRWTNEQLDAINKSGTNIIVSAGAGSGKTAVLSERVLRILKEGTHIDELLVLTFTNAAAAEMKERIRKALLEEGLEEANNVDSAFISTFDSYAYSLVKKYHFDLKLSPNIQLVDSNIISVRKRSLVEEIMEEYYSKNDEVFINMIRDYCFKDDNEITELILDFYNKSIKRTDYLEYWDKFINLYYDDNVVNIVKENLFIIMKKDFDELKDLIRLLPATCLSKKDTRIFQDVIYDIFSPLFNANDYESLVNLLDGEYIIPTIPRGSSEEEGKLKEKFARKVKKYINKYKVLPRSHDELKEYLHITLPYTQKIIEIAKILDKRIMDYKSEKSVYEFNDIANMSLKLLKSNSMVREEITKQFKMIMVDEYQDTSSIQEEFISLISNNNVYMVGDVKQSIYRFRNAKSELFTNKYNEYKNGSSNLAIDLNTNFRSRTEVLDDINFIFKQIMTDKCGGANYHKDHVIEFGFKKYLSAKDPLINNNMEFIVYPKQTRDDKANFEAKLIATDIINKINQGYPVYDTFDGKPILRKCRFSDFCILMDRGTSFETYCEVFSDYQIPIYAEQDENIRDNQLTMIMTNILKILKAVKNKSYNTAEYKKAFISLARSFVFNYSDQKLYEIAKNNLYYDNEIINTIKDIYYKNQHLSIANLFEEIIFELDIYHKIIKLGNVNKNELYIDTFLNLFNSMSRLDYSLDDFIVYMSNIDKYQMSITLQSKTTDIDSVRIMNIHKSKGLEFNIVYFSGLNSNFNYKELDKDFSLSTKIGLIFPPKNPNDFHFTKQVNKILEIREDISEKVRLFYVALTRAKEKMLFLYPLDEEEFETFEEKNIISESEQTVKNLINDKFVSFKEDKITLGDFIVFIDKYNYELTKEFTLLDHDVKKKVINIDDVIVDKGQKFDNLDDIISLKGFLDKVYYYPKFKKYSIDLGEKVKTNNYLTKDVMYKNLQIISKNIEYKEIIASRASKQLDLSSNAKNIEFGNKLHFLMEIIDFKNPNLSIIKEEFFKDIIAKFLNCDLMKNILCANIYKEYEFYDESNNINGIIDLMLVYDDRVDIIDYKTKNIDDEGYEKQLATYKKYIKNVLKMPVNCYLYSLITGQIKEV